MPRTPTPPRRARPRPTRRGTSRASLALEYRLALFHERPAPFGVILALEAVEDEPLACLGVKVSILLQYFLDDALARLDGERRGAADCARIFGEKPGQFSGRRHAIDEPDAQRLGSI